MYYKHKSLITKLLLGLYVSTVKNTARRLQAFGTHSKRNEIFIMTSLEYHAIERNTKNLYWHQAIKY